MSAHRTSGIIFILFLTFFLILVNAAEGNNEKKNDEKKIELKTFRSYSNQLFLSAIKDNSLHGEPIENNLEETISILLERITTNRVQFYSNSKKKLLFPKFEKVDIDEVTKSERLEEFIEFLVEELDEENEKSLFRVVRHGKSFEAPYTIYLGYFEGFKDFSVASRVYNLLLDDEYEAVIKNYNLWKIIENQINNRLTTSSFITPINSFSVIDPNENSNSNYFLEIFIPKLSFPLSFLDYSNRTIKFEELQSQVEGAMRAIGEFHFHTSKFKSLPNFGLSFVWNANRVKKILEEIEKEEPRLDTVKLFNEYQRLSSAPQSFFSLNHGALFTSQIMYLITNGISIINNENMGEYILYLDGEILACGSPEFDFFTLIEDFRYEMISNDFFEDEIEDILLSSHLSYFETFYYLNHYNYSILNDNNNKNNLNNNINNNNNNNNNNN